jgi:hypothetical protein
MLNTHKLLYILPDLAYVAELLPAKKEYTFSIQSFRQINGDFLNDNELIGTSIEKLFSKLDKEEYHLILPDFLFTNTIVSVEGTSKKAVLEHVEKTLLPDLDLNTDTHEIETTVLTSFKGASKVQISAIEKSVLAPIRATAEKAKVKITAISPLTWVLKSIISLEPSISVLQIGSHLYSAQHYIGVDQASNFPMEEYDAIVESIKTLKGAEPSIQSVYLVSSALVEEDIKSKLSDTLPIQQLASFKEDDSKMPSYVKFLIESSMRTISIPDFPVPKFKLGKASESDLESLSSTSEEPETEEKTSDIPEPTKKEVKEESKKKPADTDLPAPSDAPAVVTAAKVAESTSMPKVKTKIEPIEALDETETKEETKAEKEEVIEKVESKKEEAEEVEKETPAKEEVKKELKTEEEDEIPSIPVIDTAEEKEEEKVEPKKEEIKEEPKVVKDEDVNLEQFAGKDTDEGNGLAVETKSQSDVLTKKTNKKVIKNSSGVNNMLKMVFITIAVFFITIAIGVGVGLGLLKMSDKQTADTTPEIVTETPEATPTPTPTPEVVEIDKEELSILVVNATTKAGYAGKIKALLVDAEIEDTTAANAKGDYEEGTDYLLMAEENIDLQDLLEESTDLVFEYSEDIDTEDPSDKYDAVIVLAE